MAVPVYNGACIGCGKCLLICPGLAITLVDYRKDKDNPTVSIVYEVSNYPVKIGDKKILNDIDANELGEYAITAVQDFPQLHTQIVKFQVPKAIAKKVAGFRIQIRRCLYP
jgi:Fe-S-cluster-containing hydrogenase component 2